MSAFVSPRLPQPFEHDGVTFQCRPLTAEQKLPIMMAVYVSEDKISFGPEAMSSAIKHGLVGWGGDGAPHWEARDHQANVDRLSEEAYLAIGKRILDISFLNGEEKKT